MCIENNLRKSNQASRECWFYVQATFYIFKVCNHLIERVYRNWEIRSERSHAMLLMFIFFNRRSCVWGFTLIIFIRSVRKSYIKVPVFITWNVVYPLVALCGDVSIYYRNLYRIDSMANSRFLSLQWREKLSLLIEYAASIKLTYVWI
jgi:hypothetical protein